MKTTKTFRVSGAGVTVICEKGQSMIWWIEQIIVRGGTPDVQEWSSEVSRG
jgi:hypothetical protein